ncbi:uncharacterized protein LOC135340449 isoform X3 [Halichondria panicea]|uniref:uncharacterized protein LOC135340449 isoform X3 n=1 Tax=Halichondria panicea TaxID=6063 RepID=UPI00312B407B
MVAEFVDNHCPHLVRFTPNNYPPLLTPPTNTCFDCDRPLVSNHSCHIKCYSLNGFVRGRKCTLRCKACNITYNYAHFGNKSENGFRMYSQTQTYVEVSDTVYFSRDLLEWQCSLANHSWVSFQGFAESYNTALEIPPDEELSPYIVGEAFYNGEVENELRRVNKIDYRFHKDSEREECMERIEEVRRQSIYHHKEDTCTAECKKRGCGQLWVTDGIWKTVFPHCMFKVEQISDGIPALNLPDVCTNSPIRNKAFCEEHCLLLQNEAPDVPIDLRQFLKYCGAQAVENEEECEGDTDTVDAVVNSIKVNTNQFGTSATTSQVQKKRPVSVSLTKLYERIGVSPARLSGHARRKATSTTVVVRRNLLTELAKVKLGVKKDKSNYAAKNRSKTKIASKPRSPANTRSKTKPASQPQSAKILSTNGAKRKKNCANKPQGKSAVQVAIVGEDKEQCPKYVCVYKRVPRASTMIACHTCDQWFHIKCVSLSQKEAGKIAQWHCSKCM